MASVRMILAVAGKDLLRLRRDRFGLAFALGFPAAFAVAFFFMLGPGLSESAEAAPPPTITLATGEPGAQAFSRVLIGALLESPVAGFEIRSVDEAAAGAELESGELTGYILFAPDFGEGVFSGAGTRLEVVADSDPQQQAALESFAGSIAQQIQLQSALAAALASLNAPLAAFAEPPSGGVEFSEVDVGRIEPPNPADFTIPGYLVMFVFMAAAFAAAELARERASGTLARMVAAGAAPAQVLFGKFLSAAALGLLQVAVLGLFGVLVFGMDLGLSPLVTILVALLMVLVSSAFAILLASLVRTERAATPAAILAALVAAPLGGCWWPLFITPDWMQSLALITPHGWANTAFNRLMLFGGQFESVAGELIALLGFAAVFAAIAAWRFRTSPLID
ncbi:MAG: ABC transporter permease [Chloroflexi bacterium]|nr:ABC transporter permease [Chloroflexota bacterium]MYC47012.1 ABC transporter permease [Chloroflexota bacterium]